MQVTYHDGREKMLSGLSDIQLAEELRQIADEASEVESILVMREEKTASGGYPNNREGRRRWAHEQRRARAR